MKKLKAKKPCRIKVSSRGGGYDYAFTMAEILLSLTIIGIVAAITLPSLTGNINERTWNTQRKALYARMSQAIALMPSLNGYGNYSGINTSGTVTVSEDNAAETFVTNGLSKVLKINNICDAEHLADCGIASSYTDLAGNKKTFPTKLSEMNPRFTDEIVYAGTGYTNPQKDIDTKAAAIETINGESIVVFYNPFCQNETQTKTHYAQPLMCANFVYDLNGNKGPNTVGKDIGAITAMFPSDSVVIAPMPLAKNAGDIVKHLNAAEACKKQNIDSRLPNREEAAAIFYNMVFYNMPAENGIWTGSLVDTNKAWNQSFWTGQRGAGSRTDTLRVRCIKR